MKHILQLKTVLNSKMTPNLRRKKYYTWISKRTFSVFVTQFYCWLYLCRSSQVGMWRASGASIVVICSIYIRLLTL